VYIFQRSVLCFLFGYLYICVLASIDIEPDGADDFVAVRGSFGDHYVR
jgi:hypothetical protein